MIFIFLVLLTIYIHTYSTPFFSGCHSGVVCEFYVLLSFHSFVNQFLSHPPHSRNLINSVIAATHLLQPDVTPRNIKYYNTVIV